MIKKSQNTVLNNVLLDVSDCDASDRRSNKRKLSPIGKEDQHSSISSIDEEDLMLLIQGEHNNYFDARLEYLVLQEKKDLVLSQKEQFEKKCFCFKKKKKNDF